MKEITLPAKIENVEKVTAFVDEYLETLSFPIKLQLQIDIAIDEIFSNIVYYAYSDGAIGNATIKIEKYDEPERVEISFIDEGMPYNPLAKEDPNVSLAASDREIGGLGIFIVKKSMDEIKYEFLDGKNVLTIVKYF